MKLLYFSGSRKFTVNSELQSFLAPRTLQIQLTLDLLSRVSMNHVNLPVKSDLQGHLLVNNILKVTRKQ